MEQVNKQYYKASGIVLLLVFISFCINATILNPFESPPYLFRILNAVAGALVVLALFKTRKLLGSLDGLSILKYLFSFVVSIGFFSSVLMIFTPQITSLIVAKKYDDYDVQIQNEDRHQPIYYHFAVAKQKNSLKFLVNFENNNVMDNFLYLDDDGLAALTNIMKTSKDKNLMALYDELNKDGKITIKESKQILSFMATFGVQHEKAPF